MWQLQREMGAAKSDNFAMPSRANQTLPTWACCEPVPTCLVFHRRTRPTERKSRLLIFLPLFAVLYAVQQSHYSLHNSESDHSLHGPALPSPLRACYVSTPRTHVPEPNLHLARVSAALVKTLAYHTFVAWMNISASSSIFETDCFTACCSIKSGGRSDAVPLSSDTISPT